MKKGESFLCVKSNEEFGYTAGMVYVSERNACISNNYNEQFVWQGREDFSEHFIKIMSNEDSILFTHVDKGGVYKVITDRASFQIGDLWIRSVVYECLNNSVVYVREFENFSKRFCPLIQTK